MNHACIIKAKIRRQIWLQELTSPSRTVEEAHERSRKWWTRYEQVNRDYCPDDPVYSNVKAAATLSTTADLLFFKAPASGQGRLLELIVGGEATTSAVNRIAVGHANATLAGNVNVTPEKFDSRSPAAAGTYGNANTSTVSGDVLWVIGINAFCGFTRIVAAPGEEVYFTNGEVISVRGNTLASSVFSGTGIFEEL